ncbi:MAG: pyridoxamine 5'-phosphate oxidase family protein [Bacteroidetes bacterium]|nr:pyridoxamine 5'-phosphate oxidase family protein [Bacteroidota bacterium]
MLSKLTDAEIEELLGGQVIGRLGCHAEGKTYVIPISYAYDGKYIYCHTEEGMKIDFMRKNPDICLQVDNIDNMAHWQSVILWGKFEELIDESTRIHALETLINRRLSALSSNVAHLFPLWPFTSENLNNVGGVVFRMLPVEKTGRFESDQQSTQFNV